ncbi:hypothetical protein AT15_00345 [Kosmotoga arenicorallina S304]|uniref:BREX-3 system P-loop-containing protein BrxF n=1 Tax=Kosmotoga arenicorallina S304 TaxID=1453497 RepID=A0A176K0M0_9BACT|nr:BREX-3 system P-loop-containing protein BrxF [Kosmotoga arenicorallina]OAA30190.1 hypothetical protein AT15_00345 [Kosmotoga arenicorallina S304]
MSYQIKYELKYFIRELTNSNPTILYLIVGKHGAGKSKALKKISEQLNEFVVNLNMELSKALLEVPIMDRPYRAMKFFDKFPEMENNFLLLDNIELLFEPELKLHALSALRNIARKKSVIATWPGEVIRNKLLHAKRGHSEYFEGYLEDEIILMCSCEES